MDIPLTGATMTGWAGIVTAWAADAVDPALGADGDGWASSPTSTDGVRVTFMRGGSPVMGLNNINTPPGNLGVGGPVVWMPYTDAEVLAIRVANTHPTDIREGCVQAWGRWYENYQGRRG